MITEYLRPENLKEALDLLAREDRHTIALGGGLYVNEVIKDPVAVVDTQALGLNEITKKGKKLQLGGAATLQALLESGLASPALEKAIKHQENYNRRQVATLAGTLVAADGRSAVAGMLLALDAELALAGPKDDQESLLLGDFLPLRAEILRGRLITSITIPLEVQAAYHYVARSPSDLPIVGAAVVGWPSGRTRVVLLGYGSQPMMVLDGPDASGGPAAARDAYSEAGDQWAGPAYRSDIAGVLVGRCLEKISQKAEG